MARYTGPACKLCRREGEKLFLRGERCYTSKCSLEKRDYPPGEHGRNAPARTRIGLFVNCVRNSAFAAFMAFWNVNSAATLMLLVSKTV